MSMIDIDRQRILDHRCRAQQLIEPVAAPAYCDVLGAGVRDNPVGATAPLALRARTRGEGDEDGLIRAYSIRSAIHLHRRADLGLLIAALRWQHADEPARGTYGELSMPDPLAALAEAVAAAQTIMNDGESRTKGDLSGAITASLDPKLSSWCAGCQAHHLNDGLFRHAVFQAGLVIVPEPGGSFRIQPYDRKFKTVDPTKARRELLRRYLKLAGVATLATVGTWLGLSTSGSRTWWDLLVEELEPVRVAGTRYWIHPDELADLPDSGELRVSLLPPYDPYTDLIDRKLLVPEEGRRGRVWRAVRNPGVVLRGGEVIGTWRGRKARGKGSGGQEVTVELFGKPARGMRGAVEERAQHLLGEVTVEIDAD